jgi:hypothetical protein
MSSEITTAHVKQFSANVFHLSQQKGSKLQSLVRNESQKGKSAFYDRIGAVTAIEKTSRHSDTPQIDTPHSRRRVTMVDYEWADLIDDQDKIRMLIDPANDYAMAAMWALGRAKDDKIIEKALGAAYGGEEGGTSVAHPSTQKLVSNTGTTTAANLNVLALRRAKKILDSNDVDESIPRHIVVQASQLSALLGETEVTSSDYNSVKALVQGELNTFLGFNFIRLERLAIDSSTVSFDGEDYGSGGGSLANGRRCFAWAQDGLLLSTGMDVKGKIDERADKSYSTQVYAAQSVGSTRMEEEKVVEILCSEA